MLSTRDTDVTTMAALRLSTPNSTDTHNDTDDILQRLSDERAFQLLPVFVFFGLVFVLGLVGNSLTVYIYWAKFKATWSRTAIVALGIFDLVSCLVAVPGEMVDLRYSFNYHSDVMCRLSRACATFPSIASGLMLTTVAFDRYRLICTPLKSSSSRRSAKKHVLAVCILSFLVTWPAAIIYGTITIETGYQGVTGTECSTSDLVRHTKFPLVYNLVLAAIFTASFVAMIVFYALIGRQIYRQGEFRKTLMHVRDRKRKNTQSELEASFASDPDAGRDLSHGDSSEHHNNNSSADNKPKLTTEAGSGQGNADSQPSSPTGLAPPFPRRQVSRTPSLMQRLRRAGSADSKASSRTRKTTVMLCLISVVFVFSFLPHLAVKLVRTLDKAFLENAGTVLLVVYNICARSYFLNSFVNVFIYGFCSFRFRRECMKVLRKLVFCKCCRR